MIMIPQFKNKYDCIKHATDQAEKDGDKLIYYCYGGPANPISHPVPQLLASVGIEIKSLAGCEIINQENLWSDVYNLAAKDKQTTHDLTLGELVEEAKTFERQMGLEFTDFLQVGSKHIIIQSFNAYLKTGSIAAKVKTEIEWIPVSRRPQVNGNKQLLITMLAKQAKDLETIKNRIQEMIKWRDNGLLIYSDEISQAENRAALSDLEELRSMCNKFYNENS